MCGQDEFYCPSGTCILMKDTCNGQPDCYDGSDEPGLCENATSGMMGKEKLKCFQRIRHTNVKNDLFETTKFNLLSQTQTYT